MKKLLMVLLGMGLLAITVFAESDVPLQVKQLPDEAQHFVNRNFKEVQVAYATVDGSLMKSYEVGFVNGAKVEFDSKGRWTEIETPNGAVPADLVPTQIAEYVAKNHPGQVIVALERGRQWWKAELKNGFDLKFDGKFRLVGMDD